MNDAGNDQTFALFETAANRKIINDLKKSGAHLRLFPPLETEKIRLDEAKISFLTNLRKFDWLIFPDVLAVDYFLENLEEFEIEAFDLDDARVCAFGEAVSDRLRFASVHADVIPAKIETAQVFSALLDYIGEAEIGGLRFLFLANDFDGNELAESLRTKNAEVVELPIYRTISSETSELIKLKTLLKGGAIDEFVLSAPSDLVALRSYFKPETLAEVFAEIKISAFDGVMFQAAKEHDLRRVGFFHSGKVDKVN